MPPNATKVIATSRFFSGLVAEAFGRPEGDILVTGIPRNDVMVRAATRANEIKRAMGLAMEGELPRLLVWLPTFRQGVRGIVRTDGRTHASIFGMDDMDVGAFASLLRKHHCVCVAKPHPMAAEYTDKLHDDRIIIWREADLANHGLSLYEMVGAADMLITDASSVYVDYLLLNRPVIIAFADINEYAATRGFALDPIEEYLAGPLVRTFLELGVAIDEVMERDAYVSRREAIGALFHDARDDQASERLIELVLPPAMKQTSP